MRYLNHLKKTFWIPLLLLLICLGVTLPAYAYFETPTLLLSDGNDFVSSPGTYGPFLPQYNLKSTKLFSRGGSFGDTLNTNAIIRPLAYEVHSGDTLYQIAKNFSTSVTQLMADNQIQTPESLQIGQKLIVHTTLPASINPALSEMVTQVLTSTLTAYTSGYESTGKTPGDPDYGITATGSKVKEGETIAVDPSIIPMGSTVYIEGVGVRKAEDTGGAIKGTRIDVYMNNLDQAVTFGVKRNVKVYVLSKQLNF